MNKQKKTTPENKGNHSLTPASVPSTHSGGALLSPPSGPGIDGLATPIPQSPGLQQIAGLIQDGTPPHVITGLWPWLLGFVTGSKSHIKKGPFQDKEIFPSKQKQELQRYRDTIIAELKKGPLEKKILLQFSLKTCFEEILRRINPDKPLDKSSNSSAVAITKESLTAQVKMLAGHAYDFFTSSQGEQKAQGASPPTPSFHKIILDITKLCTEETRDATSYYLWEITHLVKGMVKLTPCPLTKEEIVACFAPSVLSPLLPLSPLEAPHPEVLQEEMKGDRQNIDALREQIARDHDNFSEQYRPYPPTPKYTPRNEEENFASDSSPPISPPPPFANTPKYTPPSGLIISGTVGESVTIDPVSSDDEDHTPPHSPHSLSLPPSADAFHSPTFDPGGKKKNPGSIVPVNLEELPAEAFNTPPRRRRHRTPRVPGVDQPLPSAIPFNSLAISSDNNQQQPTPDKVVATALPYSLPPPPSSLDEGDVQLTPELLGLMTPHERQPGQKSVKHRPSTSAGEDKAGSRKTTPKPAVAEHPPGSVSPPPPSPQGNKKDGENGFTPGPYPPIHSLPRVHSQDISAMRSSEEDGNITPPHQEIAGDVPESIPPFHSPVASPHASEQSDNEGSQSQQRPKGNKESTKKQPVKKPASKSKGELPFIPLKQPPVFSPVPFSERHKKKSKARASTSSGPGEPELLFAPPSAPRPVSPAPHVSPAGHRVEIATPEIGIGNSQLLRSAAPLPSPQNQGTFHPAPTTPAHGQPYQPPSSAAPLPPSPADGDMHPADPITPVQNQQQPEPILSVPPPFSPAQPGVIHTPAIEQELPLAPPSASAPISPTLSNHGNASPAFRLNILPTPQPSISLDLPGSAPPFVSPEANEDVDKAAASTSESPRGEDSENLESENDSLSSPDSREDPSSNSEDENKEERNHNDPDGSVEKPRGQDPETGASFSDLNPESIHSLLLDTSNSRELLGIPEFSGILASPQNQGGLHPALTTPAHGQPYQPPLSAGPLPPSPAFDGDMHPAPQPIASSAGLRRVSSDPGLYSKTTLFPSPLLRRAASFSFPDNEGREYFSKAGAPHEEKAGNDALSDGSISPSLSQMVSGASTPDIDNFLLPLGSVASLLSPQNQGSFHPAPTTPAHGQPYQLPSSAAPLPPSPADGDMHPADPITPVQNKQQPQPILSVPPPFSPAQPGVIHTPAIKQELPLAFPSASVPASPVGHRAAAVTPRPDGHKPDALSSVGRPASPASGLNLHPILQPSLSPTPSNHGEPSSDAHDDAGRGLNPVLQQEASPAKHSADRDRTQSSTRYPASSPFLSSEDELKNLHSSRTSRHYTRRKNFPFAARDGYSSPYASEQSDTTHEERLGRQKKNLKNKSIKKPEEERGAGSSIPITGQELPPAPPSASVAILPPPSTLEVAAPSDAHKGGAGQVPIPRQPLIQPPSPEKPRGNNSGINKGETLLPPLPEEAGKPSQPEDAGVPLHPPAAPSSLPPLPDLTTSEDEDAENRPAKAKNGQDGSQPGNPGGHPGPKPAPQPQPTQPSEGDKGNNAPTYIFGNRTYTDNSSIDNSRTNHTYYPSSHDRSEGEKDKNIEKGRNQDASRIPDSESGSSGDGSGSYYPPATPSGGSKPLPQDPKSAPAGSGHPAPYTHTHNRSKPFSPASPAPAGPAAPPPPPLPAPIKEDKAPAPPATPVLFPPAYPDYSTLNKPRPFNSNFAFGVGAASMTAVVLGLISIFSGGIAAIPFLLFTGSGFAAGFIANPAMDAAGENADHHRHNAHIPGKVPEPAQHPFNAPHTPAAAAAGTATLGACGSILLFGASLPVAPFLAIPALGIFLLMSLVTMRNPQNTEAEHRTKDYVQKKEAYDSWQKRENEKNKSAPAVREAA